MKNNNDLDEEIQKKIERAKKVMAEKGRSYEGLGDAIERDGHVGAYFGPRNDMENQKLINSIRTLDSEYC